MADLEETWFCGPAPHTSGGPYFPRQKGYRLFVDTLVKLQPAGGW